jgi:putative flippase GtrA
MSAPAAADSTWRSRIERLADSLVPASLQPRREQVQYLVVGAWNTAFGYAVWAALEYLFHDLLDYWVIVIASYPIAIANAYLTYRYIVFRSYGPILRELPRFSTVYVLTLVANLIALPVLLSVLPFSIYVTQAVFLVGVVVASYLGHRHFSFGYRGQGPAGLSDGPADAPNGSSDAPEER